MQLGPKRKHIIPIMISLFILSSCFIALPAWLKTVTAQAPVSFVNTKTSPGLVKWHSNFESACQASTRSGRPVLLFTLMGKLDKTFT